MEKRIRLNTWIESEDKTFSYNLHWPYEDNLDPKASILDVRIHIPSSKEIYQLTFVTLEELNKWFERFKSNGDYCRGTYIPLDQNEILLEEISEESINRTLDDLIKRRDFFKYVSIVEKD